MQQDEQLSTQSPFRPPSRSSSILKKPLSFLPFDEDSSSYDHNKGHEQNATDIEILPRANMLIGGTCKSSSQLLVSNTNTPNEELPALPKTPVYGKKLYNLPSRDIHGDVPYRTLSGYTPRGDLWHLPETPRNDAASTFDLSHVNYDELDEQLEEELDFSNMSTVRLMQLSGIMQAISQPLPAIKVSKNKINPILETPTSYSLSQSELFELISTQPLAAVSVPTQVAVKSIPTWKVFLNHPISKLVLGLVAGVATLLLLSRLINFKETVDVLEQHLTTAAGIMHACIGAVAFAFAFTLRGTRWKLFLNRISNVSIFKVIRIYWVGVFINFLLPVQGGEIAKSIMLKKVAGIPVSQSLPIVAMDKALDLMPVLVIIAIMPLIPGIHMNITLSLVMYLVASILVALMIVVGLTWWKRDVAIQLIHFFLRLLPGKLGVQIEGFGMGFVDSLIEGLKRPGSFIPAALLTALAILCEGIFAWQVSQAVGLTSMGLGIATFGYTVFTMFSILPTPPAQVGTSEGAKMIVFASLLGFNKNQVLGMSLLSHMIGTLLMSVIGLVSIWSLGLTLKGVLNMKRGRHEDN